MERILNIIIGVFTLTNLYYLNNFIGIPRELMIILPSIISLFYFLKYISGKTLSLLIFKLTISLFVLSLVFFLINTIHNSYEVNFNNIIRIVSYSLYFGWTFSLYRYNRLGFQKYISSLLVSILVIVALMSFFEYYFYVAFKLLISNEFIDNENKRRISVTFMDPNSFSAALVTITYIYIKNNGLILKSFFYLSLSSLLINYTGSRLGILLLTFLLIYLLFDKTFTLHFIKNNRLFVLFSSILLFTFLINFTFTESDENQLSSTGYSRIFSEEERYKSSASTNQRLESLNNGFEALSLSNLILPPGSFYFRSKWENEVKSRHIPHSSIVSMFVEYGIYVIWPLLILLAIYQKSKKIKMKFLYFMMLAIFLLLPNSIYYSTIFLIIFYIEINYEYCSNFTIPKE